MQGLENASLRQADKVQRNGHLGVEGRGWAECEFCLSLCGLLVDWLELMGEGRKIHVGQGALLGG